MALVTPDLGLIIWQLIVFVLVLLILTQVVWRPILGALKAREFQIEDALRAAEHANEEIEQLKQDNEYLQQEAKIERDAIIKEAKNEATRIIDHAKGETSEITTKMLQDARQSIEAEKRAAVSDIKNLVASLSLEIAEKVIREKLSDEKSQKELVDKFVSEAKFN